MEPVRHRRPFPAATREGKLMTAPPLQSALRVGAEGLYAIEAPIDSLANRTVSQAWRPMPVMVHRRASESSSQ